MKHRVVIVIFFLCLSITDIVFPSSPCKTNDSQLHNHAVMPNASMCVTEVNKPRDAHITSALHQLIVSQHSPT